MHDLPDDHPGVHDEHYRQRRAEIARAGEAWRPGEPIPVIDYTPEEHALWRTVTTDLRAKHRRWAAPAFLDGVEALALPDDHIPQLADLDERLRAVSGFGVHPVPGLVPARTFYGSLADGVFLSTQYVRHTSVPFYTPEPDVIHEVVGHLNMLANPTFAELHRLAGEASRRCETDEAHDFFSRVFWFTLEFGVVRDGGDVRAWGAGLLSSTGELDVFHRAELRPVDLAAMGTQDYDITHYQPVLFAGEDLDRLATELAGFFSTFDDEAHHRLLHGRQLAATAPATRATSEGETR